jgi:catechol 2,3-dioxygenase
MSPTLPDGARVGRVALAVADLDRLTHFYERVVGLVVHEHTDDWAVLGTADEPLLELHESDAPERGEAETGLFHLAVRVPDRPALGAALERVEARWLLDGASDHLVSEALSLQDPEGNGIEVYCDRPREEWLRTESGVEMDSLSLDLETLRAESDGAATVPIGTDVGHVHLEVSSIPDSRAFYVDALGLGVRDTWVRDGEPEALFVAAGDYHHHVGLNTWYGCTEPASGRGLAWFELLVPDGVDAVADRLRDAGYPVEADDAGLRVTDPDGIRLRLRAA